MTNNETKWTFTHPTPVAPPPGGLSVALRGEIVALAGAPVVVRTALALSDIKAMGDAWRQREKLAHHGLPLAPVGFQARPVFQVKDQPVGHLVGDDLIEIGLAILLHQYRVEAQPATTQVRLPGTGAF